MVFSTTGKDFDAGGIGEKGDDEDDGWMVSRDAEVWSPGDGIGSSALLYLMKSDTIRF